MAEPTLYLFDGHNLFHAGGYKDLRQLRDELASFVALKGARGYLVFDGSGADESYGPLEVRYAKNADTMLERLAAENRGTEVVCLVSSDIAVRGTPGQEVPKRSSATFLTDPEAGPREPVQEARHARGGEEQLFGQVDPSHPAPLGAGQVEEALVVIDGQPMVGHELGAQLARCRGMAPQQAHPGFQC